MAPYADKEQRPLKKPKMAAEPLKSALKKAKPAPASSSTKNARAKPSVSGLAPSSSKTHADTKKASVKTKPTQRPPTPPPTKHKIKVDKGKAKAAPAPTPKVYPTSFKVIAGTYEKLLYGLEGSFVGEDGAALDNPSLKAIFIFPAHVASVKAVAASPDGGKWLATGSTDEIVKVWDLRRKKEIGGLIQHEGANHPVLSPHIIT